MSYSARPVALRSHAISSLGLLGTLPNSYSLSATSTAWPTANLAIYVPVRLPTAVIVRKIALSNGAAVTGNFDIGIYDAAGTRLASAGSTAQSGTTTEQVVDITDLTLSPGLYYFAACLSSTGSVFCAAPAAPLPAAYGVLSEAVGSVTLPATATWVVNQTLAAIPSILAFAEGTVA